MTKSIYEKMTLTEDNKKALEYATSESYLQKVKSSKLQRSKRESIRKKGIGKVLNEALIAL